MYRKLWNRRSKPLVFRILIFLGLLQLCYIWYRFRYPKHVELSAFRIHDRTNNYMNVCSLPVYDYWHPKAMKYVDYSFDPTENCDKTFKPYTELKNGEWRIVEERKGMNCSARCFERLDNSRVNFSGWTKPGPVSCEFLEAVCWESDKEVYGYIHTQIIKKPPKPSPKHPDPPNVFVFLLDSLGTGVAKRSLPKTLSTLSTRLEAVEFPFLNKVGENSLPNGVALWFGKLIEPINAEDEGGGTVSVDWNKTEYCDTYLNNSILEEFRDNGYTTLYMDDVRIQMLMYPNCKGIKDSPADHYMYPFQIVYYADGTEITKKHLEGHLCREHRHPTYEYFQDFLEVYKDKPKFTWSWISTLGHDHLNGFMRADKELVEIIEKNLETFENSFVIFMGDHGFRMGEKGFLLTDIGSVEMNNPYLSISVPKKFRGKNMEMLNIMRQNSRRLQTHFDTRATLLDILKYQPESGFTDTATFSIPNEKGHSYLRRQPSFPRTCGHLPIPPEYCICQVEKTPVTDEHLINRFGNMFITYIHDTLIKENVSSICEEYELREVTSLYHFGAYEFSKPNQKYEITILTHYPSFAQFQTIIMHNKKTDQLKFGNIARINIYGDAGDCADSGNIKKMCFCRNLSFMHRLGYRWFKWRIEWKETFETFLPKFLINILF